MKGIFSALGIVIVGIAASMTMAAQSQPSNATTTCNFDSQKQLAIDYQPITVNTKKQVLGREIPYGKAWAPGGQAMTLFTNSPVEIEGKELPTGGYNLYVVPEENNKWMLVVSRPGDKNAKYDKNQDVVRIPMDYGQLPSPESQFSVYFAHIAPNQCSMRIDLAQSRAWAVFQEKK